VGVPTIKTGPMMVGEFYDFTDTRPDNEKWGLIDGEPILNASPSRLHQRILKSLAFLLTTLERQRTAWEVLSGLGVRVSDTSCPEPDILIIPASGMDLQGRDRDDVLVAFEIPSASTANRDLRWKRTAYASMSTLSDYVVIAQDAAEVVVFSRQNDFAERRFCAADAAVKLQPLGISLPLSEIYRDTGLV